MMLMKFLIYEEPALPGLGEGDHGMMQQPPKIRMNPFLKKLDADWIICPGIKAQYIRGVLLCAFRLGRVC
jgi:hypothetical protein